MPCRTSLVMPFAIDVSGLLSARSVHHRPLTALYANGSGTAFESDRKAIRIAYAAPGPMRGSSSLAWSERSARHVGRLVRCHHPVRAVRHSAPRCRARRV